MVSGRPWLRRLRAAGLSGAWMLHGAPTIASDHAVADPIMVLFSRAELGTSAHASIGFKRALGPSLHRPGFLLMGMAGTERPGRSNAVEASLLLGHQWITEHVLLSVFVGPELDHRSRNAALGLRVLAEIWAHPTNDTLAVTTLLIGTEPLRVWSRHAPGWRVLDAVFLGPEVILAVEERYSETRLGLHATGLAIGSWSFSLSGGLLAAQERELQGYVGLTTVLKL